MLITSYTDHSHNISVIEVEVNRPDVNNADRVLEALKVELRPKKNQILDLSTVEFIDSAGIAVLVALNNSATLQGAVLSLAAPPPSVRRLFDLVSLSRRVPIFDSTDKAVAAVV